MISNIKKFPIIILASPRTGSTALGEHLSKLYPNLTYFLEPNFDKTHMELFMNRFKSNSDDYILKLLGSSLNLYPSEVIAKIFSNEVFRIKIARKNIIEQVASHYVAAKRDIWDYRLIDNTYENFTANNIEINFEKVRYSIESIKYENNIISKIPADLTCFYEDFIQFNSPTEKTPKPINYNELLDVIKNYMVPGSVNSN